MNDELRVKYAEALEKSDIQKYMEKRIEFENECNEQEWEALHPKKGS